MDKILHTFISSAFFICFVGVAFSEELHCDSSETSQKVALMKDFHGELMAEKDIIASVSDDRTAMRWCALIAERLRTLDKLSTVRKECLGKEMVDLFHEYVKKDELFLQEKC